LEYTNAKLYRWGDIMPAQSLMMLEMGSDKGIKCRHISKYFKMDSYVYSKEKLLLEIGKIKPDVVVMDLDLYAKIDGIETSRKIRSQFDIPVMYF
jgi:CheY-like chemotaxis protein